MKRTISTFALFLFFCLSASSQYITSQGCYLEGTTYMSTSRIEAYCSKEKFAKMATISMDNLNISGSGHTLCTGEYYTIQMNFYERNIGQTILLKCKNGKVIELSSNSIQRDPFVQIFWLKENVVKDIINGEIVKIRIRTYNGFVDREIKKNTFSNAVSKCYNLLNEEKEKNKRNSDQNKSFRNF